MSDDLGERLDALAASMNKRFDGIDTRLERVEEGQQNLASQIGELTIEVHSMNTRLTSVEKVVTRVASEVGTEGVPAIGGGLPSSLPRAAKGND